MYEKRSLLFLGAADALRRVQEAGIPYILLTNSGGQIEEKKAKHFADMLGLTIPKGTSFLGGASLGLCTNCFTQLDRVFQCHTPMKNVVPEFGTKRVLLVGPHSSLLEAIARE